MSKRVGIVFGSEFTKIISDGKEMLYNDFSSVCWDAKSKEVLMFGSDAKKLIGKVEYPLTIVNPVIAGEIQDVTVFESVAHQIFNSIKNKLKSAEIIIALIAGENEYNSQFIKYLMEKYEPKDIRFENIILLAAIGAGANINDEYGTIVLDISYSKANIGIVIDGKVIASKSTNYAEKQINTEITTYFREKLGVVVSRETLEKVKFNIGSVIKLHNHLELNINVEDILTGEKKKIIITDSNFKKTFANFFASYKSMIISVLKNCPVHIRTGIVKNGLIVTGNLSKIIGVKDFFEDFFYFPTKTAKAAGNAVIEGTLKIK